MGVFEEDIDRRIRRDFGAEAETVFARLRGLRGEEGVGPRILRCVLFLSRGDLARLNQGIELARQDWRDVIFTAEYEKRPGAGSSDPAWGYEQVRDFNLPFAD